MKIDEKIQEMQSKLIKLVEEANIQNKEEAVKILEDFGLNHVLAEKLLETFRKAEEAKNKARNIWVSSLDSRVENNKEIAQCQQQKYETRQEFDEINAKCALIMVARTIEPRAINDEVLHKLYEQRIRKDQIANPALRVCFQYYCEGKVKDERIEKAKAFVASVKNKIDLLLNRISELEKQNQSLKEDNEKMSIRYAEQNIEDEKNYQAALVQISLLKNKLKRLQERSVFQIIRSKLFRSKIKELPETTEVLPETLRTNLSENMGVMQHREERELITDKESPTIKIAQEEYVH